MCPASDVPKTARPRQVSKQGRSPGRRTASHSRRRRNVEGRRLASPAGSGESARCDGHLTQGPAVRRPAPGDVADVRWHRRVDAVHRREYRHRQHRKRHPDCEVPRIDRSSRIRWSLFTGVDMTSHLGLATARRPGRETRRVNVEFPVDLLGEIDREARRLGVTRQTFIKLRLADTLPSR